MSQRLFTVLICASCVTVLTSLSLPFAVRAIEERIVEFPAPTGTLAVGRTSFRWKDTTRQEEMTEDPHDQRELVVHLWYPAAATASATIAPYYPDLDVLKKEIKWPVSAAFRAVRTRALADAPMATASVTVNPKR